MKMSSKEFHIARFQILTAALAPSTREILPKSYVYAWDESVFPIFHDAKMDDAFADDFDVSKEMMVKISKKIDDEWALGQGPGISFYDLESFMGGRDGIDRHKLIVGLRYMYLTHVDKRIFDRRVFENLLENAGAPSEASGIMMSYDFDEDIYLT